MAPWYTEKVLKFLIGDFECDWKMLKRDEDNSDITVKHRSGGFLLIQPSFSNENVENSKHPSLWVIFTLTTCYIFCQVFRTRWLLDAAISWLRIGLGDATFKSNAYFYFTPSMGEGVFIATLSPSYPNPRLAGINEMHRKRITFRDLSEAALDVLFASRLRDRNPTEIGRAHV